MKRKRIGLLGFCLCLIGSLLAAIASAQIEDLSGWNKRATVDTSGQTEVVRGERKLVNEDTSGWVQYDRTSNTTTIKGEDGSVQRIAGKLKKVQLQCARFANNYDLKTGKPNPQRLEAGTWVYVDEKGTLIAKAS